VEERFAPFTIHLSALFPGEQPRNSRLKEEFSAKNARVRGYEKVKRHLMFGVLALFADQLIKVVG